MPVHQRLECGDVTVDRSLDEDLVTDEPQSIGGVAVPLGYRHATPPVTQFVTNALGTASYL